MKSRIANRTELLQRTVGNAVAKKVVGQGRDGSVHEILEHDVLRILGANAAGLEQTKTGLQQEANDSHDKDKQDVNGQVGLVNLGREFLGSDGGSFSIRHVDEVVLLLGVQDDGARQWGECCKPYCSDGEK